MYNGMMWHARVFAGTTLAAAVLILRCAGAIPTADDHYDSGPDAEKKDGQLVFHDSRGLEASPGLEGGGPVGDTGPGCGAGNCGGCCLPTALCSMGTSDTQCGAGGSPCADCTKSKTTCKASACVACTPACSGKKCGASDGCGGTCKAGSGCCSGCLSGTTCYPGTSLSKCGSAGAACSACSTANPCKTASCSTGACKTTNKTSGTTCSGGTCHGGSCCQGCWDGSCRSGTSTSACGSGGGSCVSCGVWQKCNGSCYCGPSPHYQTVGGACKPSCGAFLSSKGWTNGDQGCCASGCKAGTKSSGYKETHDCNYCCENISGSSCS